MKVAILFGSLNRGGTETLMLDVFRSIDTNQISMIGIYRKDGVLRNSFEKSNCEMLHVAVRKNPFVYFASLRKVLIKNGVRIVHVVQSLDVILSKIACLGTDIKICQTIHGFDFNHGILSKTLVAWSLNLTDINVFVSKYQHRIYNDIFYQRNKKNRLVVYNGISFDKFCVDYKDKLNHEITNNHQSIVLLSVGNFNSGRDQLALCRFALSLKKKDINFQWFFAGKRIENDPQRYDQCVDFCKENNLEDNVAFLGSRDDVPQLLSQADLFVYASEHDTFGIAVIEAIAAGVPVMVNDWPVMNEVTLNGELATIYKTKSEDSFYECFYDFMNNREMYNEKAKMASKKVRELYSIDKHINELFERVYKPLLSKS